MSAEPAPKTRRVVLVDPTPEDAFWVSELLKRPGIAVGLIVASPESDRPPPIDGIVGVPVTWELGEVASQDADVVLLGTDCERQAEVARLLTATNARVASLDTFLATEITAERIDALLPFSKAAAIDPAMRVVTTTRPKTTTTARPATLGAAPPAPSLPAPAAATPTAAPAPIAAAAPAPSAEMVAAPTSDGPRLGEMPSPEDPAAVEQALSRWLRLLGATSGEIHGGDDDAIQWVCHSGPVDPMLACLMTLAMEQDRPQVVRMVEGFQHGRFWAAWPFRTGLRSGVLAVTGLDPDAGHAPWARVAQRLAESWERRDREHAAASFPMAPGVQTGWLSAPSFRHRLTIAVERHGRDGLHFGVHRIDLNGTRECFETLRTRIPEKLRDTDCVCSPAANRLLLLVAGPASALAPLWSRIEALWGEVWREHGGALPAPAMVVESVGLLEAADAERFIDVASGWASAA